MAAVPEAGIQIRRFTEPDQYQAAIRGGDSLYTLLGRGKFRADLTDIKIGQMRLQRGREALPRLAATGQSADKVTVTIWPGDGPLPVVRGLQIQPGEMMVFGPGVQSYHRTSGPNEFASLTLNGTDLARAAFDLTGRDLAIYAGKVLRPPEHLLARLRSLVTSALRISETTVDVLASPQSAKALQQLLMESVVASLQHGKAFHDSVPRHRHAALARRFEEVVEANLDHPLASDELSRMIGVPERSLRKICLEQIGISPRRFLALRRLHLAHQALLRADHHTTSVTAIAMDLGAWELGRFAVAYKSLFGESPSATLRRKTGD